MIMLYLLLITGTLMLILGITLFIILHRMKRRKIVLRIVIYFVCSFLAMLCFNIIGAGVALEGFNNITLSIFSTYWKNTLEAFAFKIGITDKLEYAFNNRQLFANNFTYWWFAIGYWCAFISCALTSIVTILSIIFRTLGNYLRVWMTLCHDSDILINGNPNDEQYLKSYNRKNVIMLFTIPLSNEEEKNLYYARIAYLKFASYEDFIKYIYKKRRFLKSKINIVYYTNREEERLKFLSTVINYLDNNQKLMLQNRETISFFISFSYHNFASIDDIYKDRIIAYQIHLFNKYELYAQDFQIRYSFYDVLQRNDIDKCCLKANIEPKIVYVGFGKVNQEMFRVSVMNNQFAYYDSENKRLCERPITYYFFDKNGCIKNDKNFTYQYGRYDQNDNDIKPNCPFKIGTLSKDSKEGYDAFSDSFIDRLLEALSPSSDGNEVRAQVFISCNEDLDDIDLALKITRLLKSKPQIKGRVKVYVRLKNPHLQIKIQGNELISYYGDETMLSHDHIVNEKLIFLQDGTDQFYKNYSPNNEMNSFGSWRDTEPIQFRRNAYECINDYLKLRLLGFQLDTTGQEKAMDPNDVNELFKDYLNALFPTLNEDERKELFGGDYSIDKTKLYHISSEFVSFLGADKEKKDESYVNKYFILFALSYQEKLRWNAFHIMNGYASLPFDETDVCLVENLENHKYSLFIVNNSYKKAYFYSHGTHDTEIIKYYSQSLSNIEASKLSADECINAKRHACLVSVEGLDKYHRHMAMICQKVLLSCAHGKGNLELEKLFAYLELDRGKNVILSSDANHIKIDNNDMGIEDYFLDIANYQVDTYRFDVQNVVNLFAKYVCEHNYRIIKDG